MSFYARVGVVVIALALLPGCASRRLLRLENQLLQDRVSELERISGYRAPESGFARKVDLDVISGFLDRAGYTWTKTGSGSGHLRIEFTGVNTSFGVSIQHFPSVDVLFIATSGYLRLDDAKGTSSVVLLLVQIASLNYDLLVGKFQLNPETGEVLLSTELQLDDGLSSSTFIEALEHLCHTADARYTELRHAIDGTGI